MLRSIASRVEKADPTVLYDIVPGLRMMITTDDLQYHENQLLSKIQKSVETSVIEEKKRPLQKKTEAHHHDDSSHFDSINLAWPRRKLINKIQTK